MRKLNSKKLRINHLYWDIKSVDKDDLPDNCVGRCSIPINAKIEICEQGGMEDVDTLLHEIVHAIDYSFDLKLTESQVERLGRGLTFVLRDNTWLNSYVKQKVTEEYG